MTIYKISRVVNIINSSIVSKKLIMAMKKIPFWDIENCFEFVTSDIHLSAFSDVI